MRSDYGKNKHGAFTHRQDYSGRSRVSLLCDKPTGVLRDIHLSGPVF